MLGSKWRPLTVRLPLFISAILYTLDAVNLTISAQTTNGPEGHMSGTPNPPTTEPDSCWVF